MIRQFLTQETCLKCQGCCRFKEEHSVWLPTLLNSEIELLLTQGLPQGMISPDKKIQVAPFIKESLFLCSLFNSEENKCKIYQHRPLECQIYPFLLCRRDNKSYIAADPHCPAVEGKTNSLELQGYVAYLTELLQSPQYSEALKNNPHVFQAYQDVLLLTEI